MVKTRAGKNFSYWYFSLEGTEMMGPEAFLGAVWVTLGLFAKKMALKKSQWAWVVFYHPVQLAWNSWLQQGPLWDVFSFLRVWYCGFKMVLLKSASKTQLVSWADFLNAACSSHKSLGRNLWSVLTISHGTMSFCRHFWSVGSGCSSGNWVKINPCVKTGFVGFWTTEKEKRMQSLKWF